MTALEKPHERQKSHPKTKTSTNAKTKAGQELDDALRQSFPASDPPASTQPGGARKHDDQADWNESLKPGNTI